MLTKTQVEIMKLFVSNIAEKRSIKSVADNLEKPYPLIHRSTKSLLENNVLLKDEHELISPNTSQHSVLSYIEGLRAKEFLQRRKTLTLLVKDIMETIKDDFFIFLIFGSSVTKENPRDIDMLFIAEKNRLKTIEGNANLCASRFTLEADINVITKESAYEMLREKKPNVMNETLNNHIIIYGAEQYYRVISNVR